MKEWITGRNPVFECLRAGRRHFFRLLLSVGIDESGHVPDILLLARQKKIAIEKVARENLQNISDHHQGIALETSAYPYSNLEEIFKNAAQKNEPLLMLLLDQIQDPQNLGSLLRSAEQFGVHGVVMPLDRAAGVTPAVVHASSGASEHLLIAQGNLVQAIEKVKVQNGWVIGLDMDPNSQPLQMARFDTPIALVVGSEGAGIRRLVRENCDMMVHIPVSGELDSLNAAVAGSIALYAVYTQRAMR